MKIIFLGTGEYGVKTLEKLKTSKHEILLTVTQPDSKQGRGYKLKPSPIKKKALELDLDVFQPDNINSEESVNVLKEKKADIFIVISYGGILKTEILNMPKFKCINSHPSLLPLYRGAAPIQRALMKGEKETGVSIIEISKELDTGNILDSKRIPIDDNWNYGDLTEILSQVGSELVLKVLMDMEQGAIVKRKQGNNFIYAKKVKSQEKYLNLDLKAEEIKNIIRGLYPDLTPMLIYNEQLIGITKVQVEKNVCFQGDLGEVLAIDKKQGILIKCKSGGIWLLKIKPEGKREMNFIDFVNGFSIKNGDKFFSKR